MSSSPEFTLRANLSELKAELGKIPGITETEAKKMVVALSAQLKRAESAAKDASKATKKAGDDAKNAANDAAKAAAKWEAGLRSVEKAGRTVGGPIGQITGMLGDFNDIAEGMGGTLGKAGIASGVFAGTLVGVGAALVGGYKAMDLLASSTESAIARLKEIEGAEQPSLAAAAALAEWKDEALELEAAQALLTTQLATELLPVGAFVLDYVHDAIDGWSGLAGWLGTTRERFDGLIRAGNALTSLGTSEWLSLTIDETTVFGRETAKARDNLDSLRRVANAVVSLGVSELFHRWGSDATDAASGLRDLAAAEEEVRAASEQAATDEKAIEDELSRQDRDNAERETAAAKRTADAKRKADEEQRQREQRSKEATAELLKTEQLRAGILADLGPALSEQGKLLAVYDAQLEKIDELEARAGQSAETEAMRAQAARDLAAETAELEEKTAEDTAKRRRRYEAAIAEGEEKAKDDRDEAADKVAEKEEEQTNAKLDATDKIAAATGEGAEILMGMVSKGSAAYKALFAMQKGAAIAGIGVDTARSVMAALTIPPPAGPILAGANAAAGAVQLAGVVATSFAPKSHSGSSGIAPDEQITLKSEGVLSHIGKQVAGGNAGVAAMNAGRTPGGTGGGGNTSYLLWRNSVMAKPISEMGRQPGSPLYAIKRDGRRVGQPQRRGVRGI